MHQRTERILYNASTAIATAALLSGAAFAAANDEFQPAQLWAEPIADYLAVGDQQFPDGFERAIQDLVVFDGGHGEVLWIGYGDATRNMGSVRPVENRYFVSPDDPTYSVARVFAAPPDIDDHQGAPQRTPFDSGEEMTGPFRVITTEAGPELWQPGVDSTNEDEAWTQAKPGPERLIEGNVFRLEHRDGEPVWRKFRSVPGGEHVHDIAVFDDALWAVGSGSDHRGEWEGGEIFRFLWKSTDEGATFKTVRRFMFPELGKGDTRFRCLLPIGDTLYVFGYVNPFVDGGPLEGRHIAVSGGTFADVGGEIGPLVISRTWPLGTNRGLALSKRTDDVPSRVFLVDADGIRELTTWGGLQVIDAAPGRSPTEHMIIASSVDKPEICSIYAVDADNPEELMHLLDLGDLSATSIAVWDGRLFIGTADGKLYRSVSVSP